MATNPLFQQMAEMKRSLLNEGIINSEFLQHEMLEEEINGHNDLLAESKELYFQTSLDRINIVENELAKAEPDFSLMDRTLQRFKRSTIASGAPELTAAIAMMQACVKSANLESCTKAMQNLKEKQGKLQRRLTEYLNIRRQTRPEVITHHYDRYDIDDELEHSECKRCSYTTPYYECDAYLCEGGNDNCECVNDPCDCDTDPREE